MCFIGRYFFQRPPQPRYVLCGIWRYFCSILRLTGWYGDSSINDADFICKLATLLDLTISSRTSMIQHLNSEFMARDKDKYMFFRKFHKSLRKGQAPTAITYFAFGEDKTLHALEILNECINRSKP